MIGGVVLAAGEGRRFGGPKQLAPVGGRPMIEHAIRAIMAVPAIDPVLVVLGAHADRIRAEADLQGAEALVCEAWAEGQAASLRMAVAALEEAEAIVVLLADQPFITAQVVAGVLDRIDCDEPAARATYDGAPGHPVLIKRRLFAQVAALRGDTGARPLLASVAVHAWECGYLCRGDDIDTVSDLERVTA